MSDYRLKVFERASVCRNFDEIVYLKLQQKVINYPTYLSVGEEFISATIAQVLADKHIKPDIFIQLSVPNEFQPVGKFNIGITAGIETTVCDASWIQGCNKMNLIIVPSNHAKTVFENTTYDQVDNNTNKKVAELKSYSQIFSYKNIIYCET